MFKTSVVFLSLSTSIYAATTDLGRIAVLAEETHQVVQKLAPVSDDFKQDTEGTERLVAYTHYQDEIRQIVNADNKVSMDKNAATVDVDVNCVNGQYSDAQKDREEIKELASKRKWVVGAYASYNTGDQLQRELSDFSYSRYTQFMRDNDQAWVGDYNVLVRHYLKYRKNIKAKWGTLSSEEKVSHMKKYIKVKFDLDIPESILGVEQAVSDSIQNPSKWKESIGVLKDKLSYEEKLDFLSQLGGKFLSTYSEERANSSDLSVVSIEQLFSTLGTGEEGGTCRDIVAAQSEIAMELGIDPKNIYRVGYQAAQGSHQTFAIVDPNDPSKLYKINYNETQVDDSNKGVAQLKQGGRMPVTGIAYRVYDAKGKAVLQMPTELGKMLREASGFKTNNDISKNYNINKVYTSTDFGEGAIVTGELSDGTKVSAVTFNSDVNGIEYGASFYKTDGETAYKTVSTQGFYGYMRQNPTYTYKATDKFSVAANLDLRAEVQLSKSVVVDKSTGEKVETGVMPEPSVTLTPGAEARYRGDEVGAYVRVEADTFIWNKDAQAQAENTLSGKGIILNGINYKSGISYQATENLNAALDAAVYTRNIGDYYAVRAALEDTKRNYSIEARHQAPITKDMPTFAPGSYAVTEVLGSKSWLKKDKTGPTITFGYTEDEQAGGRVNLGGSWAFY
ncbi:MAG: hypothetical protein CME64_03720 [Halobacteriovoraceae bacterium]|nr:hypothetical protein [Halobacteriovoraceae bacterium]|tara:strand:- start:22766 stop:24796 length:2031 start_codon:yes stop_codon:yes gene_type:complete